METPADTPSGAPLSLPREDLDSGKSVSAAVLLSVVSAAAFLILPLLMSAAHMSLGLNDQEIGFLSALVGLTSALGSISALFWVRKVNWRLATVITMSLMLIGHVVAFLSESTAAISLALACAGLGGGGAYSLSLTMLSDGRHPDRNFGLSLAAQVSFQVIGLVILPSVIADHGMAGVMMLLIVMDVLALSLVKWLPAYGRDNVRKLNWAGAFKPASLLALMGCFMFFFNVGCYWTYIERMGSEAGLAADFIGLGLSIGVAFGIAGALLAAWKGERFGRSWPLALSALGTVVAAIVLAGEINQWLFIASTALYNFVWNYSLAYQYAAVNAVDESGCSVAMAPAFHSAGVAAGPAGVALLLSGSGLSVVITLISLSVIVSLVLFLLAFRFHRVVVE